MTKALPHRHCAVCGKAIDPEQTTCSDTCAGEAGSRRRRQRTTMVLLLGMMLFFLLLSVLARSPR